MRNFGILLVLGLFLSACVSIRPEESAEIRIAVPTEALARTAEDLFQLDDRGADGVHTILALSGGGAYGAYGAGVLNGLSESGTRPDFDIVTMLRELYTNVTNDDIYIDKGVAGVFSASLYDYTPLRDGIERAVTEELLAKVAAEHAKGRRLYVATTNLDSGELVIWDMGEIATGGRTDPLLHFQKVLRASAAVPVFFEPVYIKPRRGVQLRQAHVDGGLRTPILLRDFLFHTDAPKKELFVIVNDGLHERLAASV